MKGSIKGFNLYPSNPYTILAKTVSLKNVLTKSNFSISPHPGHTLGLDQFPCPNSGKFDTGDCPRGGELELGGRGGENFNWVGGMVGTLNSLSQYRVTYYVVSSMAKIESGFNKK